jgi:NapC/NirT cytochrome c family, N-terminal region
MGEPIRAGGRQPTLVRNYTSFVGAGIVFASVVSVLLLFLIEVSSRTENPYVGILTYVVFPAILIFGLTVVLLGAILERRRRRGAALSDIPTYPKLDLNDPKSRRAFIVFILVTFAFVSASAFGSYRAYEQTESVAFCGTTCHETMKPEYTAFQVSPHARLRCVDCHVGSGAQWYARSKITGAYQLYAVAFNKVPKPIMTPVHNMRPAHDTCEQCHWPSKFYGTQLRTLTHYSYDEQNTARTRRLLVNVGGGDSSSGPVAGIHWHMNIANEVTYISIDDHRQVIPWVRIKDRQGNVTEYYDRNRPLTPDQIANGNSRKMDCVDCHNRPAHIYLPPDVAIDQSFAAGKLDPSLPYLKKTAVELLSKSYETTPQAVSSIASGLNDFYSKNYPDVYSQKRQLINNAAAEVQRVFQTYFFPEMRTDWQTHPNNIGHLYFSGCFRCHDGEHVSKDGKVITNNCNVCHTMIYDSANPAASVKMGPFIHPVDLGALADRKCEFCHQPNKPFQHPVNLGDISQFQCVECHQKKETKPPAN